MTVLYVREQGAVVRRDAEEIRVTLNKKLLSRMPMREIEQLVLFGNVQLTTQAAALLLQNEIDVVFLSFYGKYRGRLITGGSKFARLRHAQLKLSGDDARSLAVAEGIVRAKLANQRNLLRALVSKVDPKLGLLFERAAGGIDRMRRECGRARDADTLRGYEGKAGVYYFEAMRNLLAPNWSFHGRKYHPPPDPFNAALSFGYSLLQKDVSAAIQVVGLDPYLGCFHALEYGRPSLTLDLMEEFRPIMVDQALLNLVLRGQLQAEDFTYTASEKRPVELGPKLIPLAIRSYEDRAMHSVANPETGIRNTLRRCLELQTRLFARVVMGHREAYTGLVLGEHDLRLGEDHS